MNTCCSKLPPILKDPLYDQALEACKQRNEEYTGEFRLDVYYPHFTKGEYTDFTDDETEFMAYNLLKASSHILKA